MPPHRKVAAAGAAIMLLLAFSIFRPPSTGGPLERDFEAYYAAGATLNAGADPYSRAIWTVERNIPGVVGGRDELLPFVGPAAALPFWSLLARLPYRGALAVWTAILVAALAIVIFAALQIARAPRSFWCYGLAATFAIASAPLIGALALGQAALVSAAGIAAAIISYRVRWPAGAWGATLVAALQPNLAIALLARMRSRWDVTIAAFATVAFTLFTFATGGGSSGFLAYAQRLGAHGRAERFIAIQHTPAAIFYAFGIPDAVATALGTVAALIAAGALFFIIWRERLDPTTATLVACALLPLALPFFHEHDFVIEVLPILVLAVRTRGRARALASVAAIMVLIDWFGLAQRHFAQGQILSLGFAVSFAFIGLGRSAKRGWRPDFTGPLMLVTLAAIALPLGRLHVAPTWPDMLPVHYHASPVTDVSTMWADEQLAAGLRRRDPVWGLLRGIPLAGCIFLAAAFVADTRQRRRRHAQLRGWEQYRHHREAFNDPAQSAGITQVFQTSRLVTSKKKRHHYMLSLAQAGTEPGMR